MIKFNNRAFDSVNLIQAFSNCPDGRERARAKPLAPKPNATIQARNAASAIAIY
jgi:hypothetical protein